MTIPESAVAAHPGHVDPVGCPRHRGRAGDHGGPLGYPPAPGTASKKGLPATGAAQPFPDLLRHRPGAAAIATAVRRQRDQLGQGQPPCQVVNTTNTQTLGKHSWATLAVESLTIARPSGRLYRRVAWAACRADSKVAVGPCRTASEPLFHKYFRISCCRDHQPSTAIRVTFDVTSMRTSSSP